MRLPWTLTVIAEREQGPMRLVWSRGLSHLPPYCEGHEPNCRLSYPLERYYCRAPSTVDRWNPAFRHKVPLSPTRSPAQEISMPPSSGDMSPLAILGWHRPNVRAGVSLYRNGLGFVTKDCRGTAKIPGCGAGRISCKCVHKWALTSASPTACDVLLGLLGSRPDMLLDKRRAKCGPVATRTSSSGLGYRH
jgi:hypothetical protein